MKFSKIPLCGVLAVLCSGPIAADILRVHRGVVGGAGNGLSWDNAFSSLQSAISAAQSGDEIWVAEGVYYPTTTSSRTATFQLKSGVAIYGGFSAVESSREERRFADNSTTLSGNIGSLRDAEDNSYHVVTANGVNASTILDGFTITAGWADGAAPHNSGAGIRCLGGASLQVVNCRIINHSASGNGAGFDCNSSSPTLINTVISGNHCDGFGGGFYNTGTSSAELINCTLSGNDSGNNGGAVFSSTGISFVNFLAWNNRAKGLTSTTSSSVYLSALATASYRNSLIQHRNLTGTGTGNLDGTNAGNNPLFLTPINPASAPTFAGELQTSAGSPVVNEGHSDSNPEDLDLDGVRRKIGSIDIGAYEQEIVLRVDGSVVGGNGSGDSWGNAYRFLTDAIGDAFSGYQIWIAQGTYYPDEGDIPFPPFDLRSSTFYLNDGVRFYGGFPAGGGDGTFEARDATTFLTILSGDLNKNDTPDFGNRLDNSYHVAEINGEDSSPLIDGLTVSGGSATGNAANNYNRGGGVFISDGATPQLVDCHISDNNAARGGGFACLAASPSLLRCRIFGNNAQQGGGGNLSDSSGAIISACQISGNEASSFGGGFFCSDSSPVLLNSIITGNYAWNNGGGGYLSSSSPVMTNCTYSGNRAGNAGGGISNVRSTTTFNNCLFWNKTTHGEVGGPLASIHINNNEVPLPVFSHCLVAGYSKDDLDSSGSSPETNYEPSDPLFVSSFESSLAPIVGGDYRLLVASPAIDVGENLLNSESFDALGNPRVDNGTIDLGAVEGGALASFTLLYPGLDPDDDANGNGLSNFTDYALGGDPTEGNEESLITRIGESGLTFRVRNNASDITVVYQKSVDLDQWLTMNEDVDFEFSGEVSIGQQSFKELELLFDANEEPRMYFRHLLLQTP